jgi:hypothetical protein
MPSPIQARLRDREASPSVLLLASAVQTASGTGADVGDRSLELASALLLVLDVTAQAGTTPTLDVVIQAKIGGNYVNLARFSQYAAATGPKAVNIKRDQAFATELVPAADPAVGSGLLANNHDWLATLRVKWAIAGTTPSFTFSVTCFPIR